MANIKPEDFNERLPNTGFMRPAELREYLLERMAPDIMIARKKADVAKKLEIDLTFVDLSKIKEHDPAYKLGQAIRNKMGQLNIWLGNKNVKPELLETALLYNNLRFGPMKDRLTKDWIIDPETGEPKIFKDGKPTDEKPVDIEARFPKDSKLSDMDDVKPTREETKMLNQFSKFVWGRIDTTIPWQRWLDATAQPKQEEKHENELDEEQSEADLKNTGMLQPGDPEAQQFTLDKVGGLIPSPALLNDAGGLKPGDAPKPPPPPAPEDSNELKPGPVTPKPPAPADDLQPKPDLPVPPQPIAVQPSVPVTRMPDTQPPAALPNTDQNPFEVMTLSELREAILRFVAPEKMAERDKILDGRLAKIDLNQTMYGDTPEAKAHAIVMGLGYVLNDAQESPTGADKLKILQAGAILNNLLGKQKIDVATVAPIVMKVKPNSPEEQLVVSLGELNSLIQSVGNQNRFSNIKRQDFDNQINLLKPAMNQTLPANTARQDTSNNNFTAPSGENDIKTATMTVTAEPAKSNVKRDDVVDFILTNAYPDYMRDLTILQFNYNEYVKINGESDQTRLEAVKLTTIRQHAIDGFVTEMAGGKGEERQALFSHLALLVNEARTDTKKIGGNNPNTIKKMSRKNLLELMKNKSATIELDEKRYFELADEQGLPCHEVYDAIEQFKADNHIQDDQPANKSSSEPETNNAPATPDAADQPDPAEPAAETPPAAQPAAPPQQQNEIPVDYKTIDHQASMHQLSQSFFDANYIAYYENTDKKLVGTWTQDNLNDMPADFDEVQAGRAQLIFQSPDKKIKTIVSNEGYRFELDAAQVKTPDEKYAAFKEPVTMAIAQMKADGHPSVAFNGNCSYEFMKNVFEQSVAQGLPVDQSSFEQQKSLVAKDPDKMQALQELETNYLEQCKAAAARQNEENKNKADAIRNDMTENMGSITSLKPDEQTPTSTFTLPPLSEPTPRRYTITPRMM